MACGLRSTCASKSSCRQDACPEVSSDKGLHSARSCRCSSVSTRASGRAAVRGRPRCLPRESANAWPYGQWWLTQTDRYCTPAWPPVPAPSPAPRASNQTWPLSARYQGAQAQSWQIEDLPRRVLQDEHDLEQRAVAQVSLGLQRLDHLLERHILVGIGLQGTSRALVSTTCGNSDLLRDHSAVPGC